jgi:hypothetical protein
MNTSPVRDKIKKRSVLALCGRFPKEPQKTSKMVNSWPASEESLHLAFVREIIDQLFAKDTEQD